MALININALIHIDNFFYILISLNKCNYNRNIFGKVELKTFDSKIIIVHSVKVKKIKINVININLKKLMKIRWT